MLLQIDELVLDQHPFLSELDDCWYLKNFTANVGYLGGPTNNLILNFKKSIAEKGKPSYYYKEEAIRTITSLLKTHVVPHLNLKETILTPIPPSKSKSHSLYDDRMLMVLQKAFSNTSGLVKEVIFNKGDMDPSHLAIRRPRINELMENYVIDTNQLSTDTKNIILFDDVLTTGAHFIACKNKLLEINPNFVVKGIFIARREIS